MSIEFSEHYCLKFNAVLALEGLEYLKNPKFAILIWEEFINEIREGNQCIPPEFDHDLQRIRPQIEILLAHNTLTSLHEHLNFVNEIKKIDAIFREYTMENPACAKIKRRYWFEHRILRFAGEDYANFINAHFKKKFGVCVEIIN